MVAIIDAGLDFAHPDLSGQLWTNPGETPGNHQDDDGNGYVDDVLGWNFVDQNADLSDATGHGMQVAGIVAAATDNGIGVAGVCWRCRVMIVKVVQPNGVANYSDIAAAVLYAAQKGAKVINLSLGGNADSITLRAAITAAAETAVIVGGAGNDNASAPFYPAAYDSVLAVAGTTSTDAKVATSNYGHWVDVTAPGEVLTTTFQGSGYGSASGTSLAAPLVAGLAGLLRSQHPDWTAAMVRAQIAHTTDPIELTQYRVAVDIGVAPLRISQIVHGKRATTADTALRLARYFGTTPGIWLRLQARNDLEVAQEKVGKAIRREVKELRRPAAAP